MDHNCQLMDGCTSGQCVGVSTSYQCIEVEVDSLMYWQYSIWAGHCENNPLI